MAKKKGRFQPFSKAKIGAGGRFETCVRRMKARGKVRNPKAVCATIGRRKFGKARFQKLAAKGRRSK